MKMDYEDDFCSNLWFLFQIRLIPRAENTDIYTGTYEKDNLRYEFERNRCSEAFYEGHPLETIPEICRDNHFGSIGFYVYGQAFGKNFVIFFLSCSIQHMTD